MKLKNCIRPTAMLLIAISFVFGGCTPNKQQSAKCKLRPSELPAVFGIRLGDKLGDLRKRFPELEFPQIEKYAQITIVRAGSEIVGVEKPQAADGSQVIDLSFDPALHPDLESLERISVNVLKDDIFGVAAAYTPSAFNGDFDAFSSALLEQLDFHYEPTELVESAKDKRLFTCTSESPTKEESNLTTYFEDVRSRKYPVIALFDKTKFLAFVDFLSGKSESQTKVSKPVESSLDQVLIAGVLVKVGQDAYISQDRLEQYLVSTVGNKDTYSFGGKRYEISYAPGERGAYFVESIKEVP